MAWLYVALTEAEYRKLYEEYYENPKLFRNTLFSLDEVSSAVVIHSYFHPTNGSSHSGDRSISLNPAAFAVENTILELIEGRRFNDTSDSNWSFWGISLSARPGCIPDQKAGEKLEKFLLERGITAERFQKAFFQEGTDSAYTDLDGACNNL